MSAEAVLSCSSTPTPGHLLNLDLTNHQQNGCFFFLIFNPGYSGDWAKVLKLCVTTCLPTEAHGLKTLGCWGEA